MLRTIKVAMLITLLFLLTACMNDHNQSERNNDVNSPFMKLTTDGQQENPSNQPMEERMEEPLENQDGGEESVNIEETPNEHEGLHQSIPGEKPAESVPNEVEIKEEAGEVTRNYATELPLTNFKERWNAISEARFSPLYINEMKEVTDGNNRYYHAQLTDNIQLHVYVIDNFIQQLKLISKTNSSEDVFTMLAGWEQIINILHPNIEINDVDQFYNKIGVGPDADLSKVKATSFFYYHLFYEIVPTEDGYQFSAKYSESIQGDNE